MTTLAARFHFLLRPSRPAITFALRNTAAALAALVVAILLGLDSPHWAAMTVWIVAQPTRGMVISKGLYRLAGTMVGSAVAGAIIILFGQKPLELSLSLALWVGICAGGSTLLPGFRAYGAILAGYSAALVAVIGLGRHEDIMHVASSRVATVALGIVVSGLVTTLFLPGSSARDLLVRSRTLGRDTLRWASLALAGCHRDELIAHQNRLLSEIAQINAQCDMAAAGSKELSARVAHLRAMIAALVTLMAQVRARNARRHGDEEELARELAAIAANPARASRDACAAWPDIAQPLLRSVDSYRALASQGDAGEPETGLLYHPDWKTAALAAFRGFSGVAAAGILWTVTGWGDAPPMLMAAAIMGSVFAATDTPSRNVLLAMKGSFLAVVAATLTSLLLHSMGAAGGLLPISLTVAVPFMLAAGLAMSNRATLIPGTDFGMLYLLLAQPGMPVHPTPEQLMNMGLGILCGMTTAALVNRIGQPASPASRAQNLTAEIVRDLRLLALSGPGKGSKWRNKALHRILRLVLKSNEAGGNATARLDGALAALNVGLGINRVRAVLHHGTPSDSSRAGARAALDSFTTLTETPEVLAKTLLDEADRQDNAEIATALRIAGDALAAHAPFFKVPD